MKNILRFFSKPASAPAARERLQLLLAHERAAFGDKPELVGLLRDEILALIAKHVEIEGDRVNVKMERGEKVSTLAIDIEIPFGATKKAA